VVREEGMIKVGLNRLNQLRMSRANEVDDGVGGRVGDEARNKKLIQNVKRVKR
jgi:hypothetical protein